MKERITTICYGEKDKWTSMEEAKAFFIQAMAGSDGSERERYTNIYMQLCMGMMEYSDEMD